MADSTLKSAFRLKRNHIEFMDGGLSLLIVVFNHLNGSIDHSRREQKRYQDTMGPALMGGQLQDGDVVVLQHHGHEVARYTIGEPVGDKLTERAVFTKFMSRVASEMGVDEVSPVGFLASFRDGLTAAEAVLRDRLDAGVLIK